MICMNNVLTTSKTGYSFSAPQDDQTLGGKTLNLILKRHQPDQIKVIKRLVRSVNLFLPSNDKKFKLIRCPEGKGN